MKVAIVCEDLLQKDSYSAAIEQACRVFENVSLYAICYRIEALSGSLKEQSIRSTFLASLVKSPEQYKKWSFLVPGAMRMIQLEKDVDLVISFSKGYAHLVETPGGVKHIAYFFDALTSTNKQSFREKVFNNYLSAWKNKQKININTFLSAGPEVEKSIQSDSVRLYPPFNDEKFPVAMAKPNTFKLLVNLAGLAAVTRKSLLRVFQNLKIDFTEAKVGECCSQFSEQLAEHSAYLDISKSVFPQNLLSALSTGRPVIALDTPINRELLGEDCGAYIHTFNDSEIAAALLKVKGFSAHYNEKKLKRYAMLVNEMSYKRKLLNFSENSL